ASDPSARTGPGDSPAPPAPGSQAGDPDGGEQDAGRFGGGCLELEVWAEDHEVRVRSACRESEAGTGLGEVALVANLRSRDHVAAGQEGKGYEVLSAARVEPGEQVRVPRLQEDRRDRVEPERAVQRARGPHVRGDQRALGDEIEERHGVD